MDAGALDVSVLPVLMKKGRSGNVIRASPGMSRWICQISADYKRREHALHLAAGYYEFS
jgi:hypothetical protein